MHAFTHTCTCMCQMTLNLILYMKRHALYVYETPTPQIHVALRTKLLICYKHRRWMQLHDWQMHSRRVLLSITAWASSMMDSYACIKGDFKACHFICCHDATKVVLQIELIPKLASLSGKRWNSGNALIFLMHWHARLIRDWDEWTRFAWVSGHVSARDNPNATIIRIWLMHYLRNLASAECRIPSWVCPRCLWPPAYGSGLCYCNDITRCS